MYLFLHMMISSMVLKQGALYVNYSPVLFQIEYLPLIIFPSPIAIFLPYFS